MHAYTHAAHTAEERDANRHLGEDAAIRPDVDGRTVQITVEDELWRPVEARAHIRDARLPWLELLRGAKIGELQLLPLRVDQDVVGLDVPMHHAE